VHVFGASDLVAPFLGAGVNAGVQVRVVEDDGVCVEHGPHGGAAVVGEDAAEHLAAPVEALHALLRMVNGKWIAFISRFYPKRFTVASHSPIHTPTAVSNMHGNNQHIRSS